jgi:hypothetical protein
LGESNSRSHERGISIREECDKGDGLNEQSYEIIRIVMGVSLREPWAEESGEESISDRAKRYRG